MQSTAPSRGWCVQVFRVSPDRAPVLVDALRSAEPGAHPAVEDAPDDQHESLLVIETRDDPALLERIQALVLAEDTAAVRAHVSRVDPALLVG